MRRLIAVLLLAALAPWAGCNVTTNVISIRGDRNVTTMSADTTDGGADVKLPSVNVTTEKEQ